MEVLKDRACKAVALLESCEMCPRRCRVDRLHGEVGFCRTGREATINSAGPHFGEEAPLSGYHGSGTIFFCGCNLSCIYCQNYEISQECDGVRFTASKTASAMIHLQNSGCHNINLVTPTHVVPQILESLVIAKRDGLHIPLVYNSGGYDSVDTLRLLEGIIDIYMPDAKYGSSGAAASLSMAPDYVKVNREAITEMHRQVGDLQIEDGIAVIGLIVRHLVLPDGLAGTREVVDFLAGLSKNTYLNIMAQYRPMYKAARSDCKFPALGRRITNGEYAAAIEMAVSSGMCRGL
jgi:putative pyruvate formate lyase activating enzyme